MARKALLVVVLLAVAGLAAWQAGLVGPSRDTMGEVVPDGAPPGEVAAPGSPEAAALAAGRAGARAPVVERPVARTKPPEAGAPRITGRVIDAAGAPVADVRVVTIPDTFARSITLDDLGAADVPAFDAITDAQGRFAVAVGPDAPLHAIVAVSPLGAMALDAGLRAGADVTLTLDDAGSLVGTVTDLDGTPVAGAKVAVSVLLDAVRVDRETTTGAAGAYRLDGVPAGRPSVRRGVARGVLLATAAGFAPLMVPAAPLPEPGRTRERPLVLTRGSTLTGKVLDAETDAPVAGARVVAWSSEGSALTVWRSGGKALTAPWSPRIVGETTTDAAGAFRIERLPCRGFHGVGSNEWDENGPQLGRVAALAAGCCPATASVGVRDEGGTQDVTLKLWGAATVTGRVVGVDGAPLADVMVSAAPIDRPAEWLPPTLFPEAASPSPDGTGPGGTGSDGTYRLARVPVRRARDEELKLVGRVVVRGPAWGRQPSEDGDGTVTVKLRAGATVVAPDLVVKPPAPAANVLSARVRVLLPDGQPAWGATVQPLGGPGFVNDRADRDGWVPVSFYVIPRRPASGPMTVRATLKGYAPTDGTVTPTVEGAETVTVTLKPARRVTGRVLTSERAPAPEVNVQVGDGSLPLAQVFPEPRGPGNARNSVVPPPPPGAVGGRGARPQWGWARTDEEGRFVVEGLPDGPYHVVAQPNPAPGSPTPRARGVASDVPSDATALEIVLPPDPTPPTGAVVGSVRDASTGRAPPKLSVVLKRDDVSLGAVASGQDGVAYGAGTGAPAMTGLGRYEFPTVPAGPIVVNVTSEGYVPRAVEVVVRAGETTTVPTVELHRGTTVRGRVRAPDGASAKGARQLGFAPLDDQGGLAQWITTVVAADGSYEVSGLLPGRWRVQSWVDGSGPDESPHAVPADGALLTIPEGGGVVTFDPALVVAGTLNVNPVDARLPAPQWDDGGGSGTDEQRRFAAGCRVQVLDAAGVVVAEQVGGFARAYAPKVGWVLLQPGTYTVRMEMPGEERKEQAVEVKPREQTTVPFGTSSPPGNAPGRR